MYETADDPSITIQKRNIELKRRVKKYSSTVYKQVHKSIVELRTDTVCMRENSFYVDTVRAFRDRRYHFKDMCKVWKGRIAEAAREGDMLKREEAEARLALFDSL